MGIFGSIGNFLKDASSAVSDTVGKTENLLRPSRAGPGASPSTLIDTVEDLSQGASELTENLPSISDVAGSLEGITGFKKIRGTDGPSAEQGSQILNDVGDVAEGALPFLEKAALMSGNPLIAGGLKVGELLLQQRHQSAQQDARLQHSKEQKILEMADRQAQRDHRLELAKNADIAKGLQPIGGRGVGRAAAPRASVPKSTPITTTQKPLPGINPLTEVTDFKGPELELVPQEETTPYIFTKPLTPQQKKLDLLAKYPGNDAISVALRAALG